MSTLSFKKKPLMGVLLNTTDKLPMMQKQFQFEKEGFLDEDDGLFINYGKLTNTLPYQALSTYGEELIPIEFETAVLENDYLKAEFVPSLGGRLWSLYDKEKKRDLVMDNPVFRPRNLALRNAWFSGGVEWNIGMRGHSPFTCDQLYAAKVKTKEGFDVLRMYQFERARSVVFQMDFFLPDDSKFLFARMRIVNHWNQVTPMYWWSTTAVAEKQGSRVIVPASEAYINQGQEPVCKKNFPNEKEGSVDASYPTNNPVAIDFFFNIKDESRKYIANIEEDGYGLVQVSTQKLTGRKIFVWGQHQGSKRWQDFLTSSEGKPYIEIQAGLAKTQNECLPMPPKTAWEWIEAYGPIETDPKKITGDYAIAQEEVLAYLNNNLPEKHLEKMLKDTKESIALVKGETVTFGEPWGALENYRREKQGENQLSAHLDFGGMEENQIYWADFLDESLVNAEVNGSQVQCSMGRNAEINSFMVQNEWFEILKSLNSNMIANSCLDKFTDPDKDKYAGNWQINFHLGMCYYFREDLERAEKYFLTALNSLQKGKNLKSSFALACHGLMNLYRAMGKEAQAANYGIRACNYDKFNTPLHKEVMGVLVESARYEKILELYKVYQGEKAGYIELYKGFALAHLGKLEEALSTITPEGGLQLQDYREGENISAELYQYILWKKDETISKEKMNSIGVPYELDFRMFSKNEE